MKEHDKIRVLYVQPGKYPEERWVRDELADLQQLVGGLIECVSMAGRYGLSGLQR